MDGNQPRAACILTLLAWTTCLVWAERLEAVENFRVSSFGDAKQIWFEAEDFDARTPEGDDHFVLVSAEDAFGEGLNAVNRTGLGGGRLTYHFDLTSIDGQAGTWYFWGRVINPANTSDFLLVDGHPGDVVPDQPPFAGDFADVQRIFEQSQGPPWTWGINPAREGHVKQLQSGSNTMHLLHRQGDASIFWDAFVWTDSPNYVPTDGDYLASRVAIETPGDFNQDGAIDLADFAIMATHFGQQFPLEEAAAKGDATGDRLIDLRDFIKVRQLFQDAAPIKVTALFQDAAQNSATTLAPEPLPPSNLFLGWFFIVAVAVSRCQRRE